METASAPAACFQCRRRWPSARSIDWRLASRLWGALTLGWCVPLFKIVAVIFIGILSVIGFFDLGQEAYTLAALLGIGALLDYGKRTAG
jgi:hypothetical protein